MARSALDEMSDSGAFVRSASTFRQFISRDPNSQFPAEPGRYHLYISYACPWASRCLAYLSIKGLHKAISFSVSRLAFMLNWIFSISNEMITLAVVPQRRNFIFHIFNYQSVNPIWARTKESDEHMGWVFPDSKTEVSGAEPDLLNGAKSVRELYEIASTNYTGKFTVPVCFLFRMDLLLSWFVWFAFLSRFYIQLMDFHLHRFCGIRNSRPSLTTRAQR